jgi:hypothetical protein
LEIAIGELSRRTQCNIGAALTLSGLVDAFMAGHVAKLKEKSRVSYEGSLAKLKSAFGSVKAEALTRSQVAGAHNRLS